MADLTTRQMADGVREECATRVGAVLAAWGAEVGLSAAQVADVLAAGRLTLDRYGNLGVDTDEGSIE